MSLLVPLIALGVTIICTLTVFNFLGFASHINQTSISSMIVYILYFYSPYIESRLWAWFRFLPLHPQQSLQCQILLDLLLHHDVCIGSQQHTGIHIDSIRYHRGYIHRENLGQQVHPPNHMD